MKVTVFFFFKQKTAYEMRISDWSSDVCSSDLPKADERGKSQVTRLGPRRSDAVVPDLACALIRCLGDRGASIALDAALEEHGSVVPFLDVGCGGTTAAVTLLDRVQRKLAAMTRGLLGPHRSRQSSEERRVGKESVSTCGSRW